MPRMIQIVVIGDSKEKDKNNAIAYETGRFIAERGWALVSGGRGGVMESASRGAHDAGGTVVSILPGYELGEGNDYATIKVPTGIGWARNSSNVLCGDVVVAVGGGAGTLTEIGYAWTYKKPIIACAWADGWSARLAGESVDATRADKILSAGSFEELKSLLNETVERLRGR